MAVLLRFFCWPRSPMKLWNATSSDAAEWWDTKREISVIDLLVKEKEHKKDTILFSLVSETGTIKISVQEACITCNLRYKIKLVSKPTQPTLDASRCLFALQNIYQKDRLDDSLWWFLKVNFHRPATVALNLGLVYSIHSGTLTWQWKTTMNEDVSL